MSEWVPVRYIDANGLDKESIGYEKRFSDAITVRVHQVFSNDLRIANAIDYPAAWAVDVHVKDPLIVRTDYEAKARAGILSVVLTDALLKLANKDNE